MTPPSVSSTCGGDSWHGGRQPLAAGLVNVTLPTQGGVSQPDSISGSIIPEVEAETSQVQDTSTVRSTAGSTSNASTHSLAHLLSGEDSSEQDNNHLMGSTEQCKPQQEEGTVELYCGVQPPSLNNLADAYQQDIQGRSAQQPCPVLDSLPFRAGSVMRLSQVEQDEYGVTVIAPPPSVLYKVQMGSGEPAEVRPLDSWDSQQDMLPITPTVPLHQVLAQSCHDSSQQVNLPPQPQLPLPPSLDLLTSSSAVQDEVVPVVLGSAPAAPLQPVSSLTSLTNIGPQSILPMQMPGIDSLAALPRIHRAPGRVSSVSRLGTGISAPGFRQAEGSAGSVEGPVRGGAPRGSGGGGSTMFGSTMRRIATTPAGMCPVSSAMYGSHHRSSWSACAHTWLLIFGSATREPQQLVIVCCVCQWCR
jgi:hypothetical protein